MKQRWIYCVSILLVGLLLDQLHKWWMLDVVNIAEQSPLQITSFFNLVMAWNTGISFSMFADAEGGQAKWLTALALAIIAMLLWWMRTAEDNPTAIGIGLIVGGALGNVIDRVRFGAVADFFDFHVMGYHWPAFNIADSLIFCGVVLIIVQSFRNETQDS